MFERIQENVARTLEGSVKVIDTDNFTTLVSQYEADPEMLVESEDPYYLHQDEIFIIKELFSQVDTVYTYVPGQAEEILWIGDSWREDETQNEYASYFKESYTFPEGVGFIDGLEKTVPPSSIYQDEYGSWVSGFTPIRDTDGNTIGALGIDISVSYIDGIRDQVAFSLLPPFAIVSFLLLGITWISAWINRRGGVRWPKYKVLVERVE
jgi:hypothetical protein